MKICVYGASSDKLESEFFTAAEELGRLIAESKNTLVFGGGQTGLMGACARGAHRAGGKIIGIAPRFFDEPGILDKNCSEFLYTETMRERKQLMEDLSDAFIAMPGGIGSYEELFEILTLKQLGRHAKPIALLNTADYYSPLYSLLQNTARRGFMSEKCMELFKMCATPAQALDHVMTHKPCLKDVSSMSDYHK